MLAGTWRAQGHACPLTLQTGSLDHGKGMGLALPAEEPSLTRSEVNGQAASPSGAARTLTPPPNQDTAGLPQANGTAGLDHGVLCCVSSVLKGVSGWDGHVVQ